MIPLTSQQGAVEQPVSQVWEAVPIDLKAWRLVQQSVSVSMHANNFN